MKLFDLLTLLGILCLISTASAATTIAFNPVPITPSIPATFNYTVYTTDLTNASFITANATFPRLDLVLLNCFKNNTNLNGISFQIINLSSTVSSVQVNATNTSQLFSSGAIPESLFTLQLSYYNGSFANNDSVPFDTLTTQWFGNTSTKDTGYNAFTTRTGGWVNTTLTNSTNTQDIVMAGAYNLVITVTATDTGLVIPGVNVTDSNNQVVVTDAIGVATLTEPFSTVAGTLVATGYVSRSWSIVVDNDTSVTYQMTPATAAPVQNTWYTPHQVRFAVVDNRDNKLVGVTVNATAIGSTFPTDSTADWLTQMYGINPDAANDMLNGTLIMHGTTGGDGSTTFTMHSSIGYSMQVYNPANGVIHTTSVNPIDSLYTIRIAGTTINNTFVDMGMNTSLFITEPNTTHVTMNLRYQDNSSKTTLLDFFVVAQINNTIINHQVFTGFGNSQVLANYTVRNTKPNAYSWYYNAVRNP